MLSTASPYRLKTSSTGSANTPARPRLAIAFVPAAVALLMAAGCADSDKDPDPDPEPPADGAFESYWPGGGDGWGAAAPQAGLDAAGGTGGATGAEGFSADDATNGPGATGAAERAITEADIIQVQGDRLYAFSRYSGLSVVDVSERDRLQLLGQYSRGITDAEPFEMYVRDGVAMVMFTSWGEYVEAEDASGWLWVQTSKLLSVDVSDPADMQLLGSFDVPGAISDSRIVGDVLYVVGYQDGYCWRCEQEQPLTAVVSLDVSDPRAVEKVDELRYADDDNQWGWNRRSIAVTTERMYVAGPEEGQNQPAGSSIQIIDISDPSGRLVEGATVEAEGRISSRWQMNEYEGVLRVLSQPPVWDLDEPPVIQTFTVVSSQEIEPLGRAELVLPRPEELKSARFDGPRAYAITFERTDPLFTIDLSDPENPRQAGELEMPGWVYHMEPRGDRLVGLGFDDGAEEGGITVSLFDVSDLSQPTMADRVNFGGEWGSLPEDQDRIHKAFRVLDELGLILVPYSSWSYDEFDYCERNENGVQLVDFERDSLVLRGAVSVRGEARRAFVHDTRLFAVSDQQVESFDIDDRSEPVRTASLALARNVEKMLPLANGAVARLTTDWWSDTVTVDFVQAADVSSPQSGMSELVLQGESSGGDPGCNEYMWVEEVLAQDDFLLLVYGAEQYSDDSYTQIMGLWVVDASDPESPVVLSDTTWKLGDEWWVTRGSYRYALPSNGSSTVLAGNALAMLEVSYEWTGDDDRARHRLRVVDISDPKKPQSNTLNLPDAENYGALLASGSTVVTSHYAALKDKPDVVRFYLDRVDVSDPSEPRVLDPTNVPGAVLDYDHEHSRAVTVELRRIETLETTWDDCAERFASFDFTDEDYRTDEGTCTTYTEVLHLLSLQDEGAALLDSYEIADDRWVSNWSMGDGVLFATLETGYGGGGVMIGGGMGGMAVAADCFGPCGYYEAGDPSELLTLGGVRGDAFEAGLIRIEDGDSWYGWWSSPPVYAAGTKALVTGASELSIVDASDPARPVVERTEPLNGHVEHLAVADDTALLSLGINGAQAVDLDR